MSDTVKIVIEMPKEDYEFTKGARTARFFASEYYVKLILNGTPLDDVLDKIRTETEEQYKWLFNTKYTRYDVDIAFNSIFRIVDKYRNKAESEDKE